MKKLILIVLAMVSFTFVKAQNNDTSGLVKGDVFISGSFGYSSQSIGNDDDNTFTISPRVGYFLTENIAAGVRLRYQNRKNELGLNEIDTKTFNIGAFGRYYFTPTNKFSVFGEFGLDYLSQNSDIGASDITTDGFSIGGGPGVSYFIGNHFALEAFWGVLTYTTVEPDVPNSESTDSFDIGVDFDDITLGLVYKF